MRAVFHTRAGIDHRNVDRCRVAQGTGSELPPHRPPDFVDRSPFSHSQSHHRVTWQNRLEL